MRWWWCMKRKTYLFINYYLRQATARWSKPRAANRPWPFFAAPLIYCQPEGDPLDNLPMAPTPTSLPGYTALLFPHTDSRILPCTRAVPVTGPSGDHVVTNVPSTAMHMVCTQLKVVVKLVVWLRASPVCPSKTELCRASNDEASGRGDVALALASRRTFVVVD